MREALASAKPTLGREAAEGRAESPVVPVWGMVAGLGAAVHGSGEWARGGHPKRRWGPLGAAVHGSRSTRLGEIEQITGAAREKRGEVWRWRADGRPAVYGCALPLRLQKERPFFPTFGDEERESFLPLPLTANLKGRCAALKFRMEFQGCNEVRKPMQPQPNVESDQPRPTQPSRGSGSAQKR